MLTFPRGQGCVGRSCVHLGQGVLDFVDCLVDRLGPPQLEPLGLQLGQPAGPLVQDSVLLRLGYRSRAEEEVLGERL